MDIFRKMLISDVGDDNDNYTETVEKLVDRISTSTLIDDRRDAVRALKSLSKKFRLEVGTQAMLPIINIMFHDKNDPEIVGYSLETLFNIMNEDTTTDDVETNRLVNIPPGLGVQFTEMFINKLENLDLVILFIEDPDFYIRRQSVQLLHVCLVNMAKDTQDNLLRCPMAISKIVDLLSDPREVIRNDSLLLLTDLVRNNGNIQKIVAFENAFERLLAIIAEEGDSEGGVIVEDCLKVIHHLLENNPQNQTLFKEGNYIKRLTTFFEFTTIDDSGSEQQETSRGWIPQKLANVEQMLQVIRSLVSPLNKSQATIGCQHVIRNCGLFQKICNILMSSGIPPELLTETVMAVAEIMRGCQNNQDLFSQLMAPSHPPQPAINVLLYSMVTETQNLILRYSAQYCFQCFLFKNYAGQNYVIQTLLPKSSESKSQDQYNPGRVLCIGLFSQQPLSVWFAAVSLMHCINNDPRLKEELLKVQLATAQNTNPITLLQKCCNMLSQGLRPQAKIGILMLICVWLSSCPSAVSRFLMNDPKEKQKNTNLSFMMSELSGVDNEEAEVIVRGLSALILGICVRYNNNNAAMNAQSILQTIERIVDKEALIEYISHVTKTEAYTKAMRHLQPQFNKASDILFDYEFTRLFRSLEHEVVQCIHEITDTDGHASDAKRISQFTEHESIVLQFKDLIKNQDEELHFLRSELEKRNVELKKQALTVDRLREEVQTYKDQCSLLKAKKSIQNSSTTSLPALSDTSQLISDDQTGLLLSQLDESRKQIEYLKNCQMQADLWKSKHDDMQVQLKCFQHSAHIIDQLPVLESELNRLRIVNAELLKDQSDNNLLKKELEELKNEYTSMKAEHDDLLVLLADQEDKIQEMKSKLGIELSDNEDRNSLDGTVD